MLTARQRDILKVVIDTYIDLAQPVSSKAVEKRLRGRRLSSATIRSVMGELEGAGYLRQPHTSAGREPTEAGFKVYVELLAQGRLLAKDRILLQQSIDQVDSKQFPAALGTALARLSGQVAVVAVPRFLGSRFHEVGLARLAAGRFVVYFLSRSGLVQEKLIEMDFDLHGSEVEQIQNYLNDQLHDRTLEEVRASIDTQLDQERAARDMLWRRTLELGARALPEARDLELFVEGTRRVAEQPEFSDVEKLRGLLRAIDEKETLLSLIDRILDETGVRVMLSSELSAEDIEGLACVAGAFRDASGQGAAITLLGPPRMNYRRVVPLISFATDLFGRYWKRL